MNLMKFYILEQNEEQTHETVEVPILINCDHIVSIKPIRIVIHGNVIEGHWLRLSNGKKYRATEVPAELQTMFKESQGRMSRLPSFDEFVSGPFFS